MVTRTLTAAMLAAMVGLSGVVLGQIYAGPLLTHLVLGAAVGSVAVSVAVRRLPAWVVGPVSAAALGGYATVAVQLTARHSGLSDPWHDLLDDAARNGIPRLLTAMIPVEPLPDTVLIPVAAAWLAGLTAAETALRARRLLLAYLPPVLLYGGVLFVVGRNAEPALSPTVAYAVVGALGLALDTASRPTAQDRWRIPIALRIRLSAGTAAAVAVVIGFCVAIAPVVAARVRHAPVDPRSYVQPPVVDSLDKNPLSRISGWALNPDETLFDLRTVIDKSDMTGSAGGSMGLRIRLAVLSDYDGVTWRVEATYRNAGRVLPVLSSPADAVAIRQEITVGALTGRLMPAVATPRTVSGTRVAYDPANGTLIRPEGLHPGLRYEVTSLHERTDPNLLPAADIPSGDQVARFLHLADGVPDQLRQLASTLAADNGAPYDRALAIEQFLAEHYRLVADAPSGHAYPNLSFFLFGPREAGGQRGTSEQFAAAFAVLGRLMGLPTRVVVGFYSETGNGPVRAGDAYAWPEVLFDELGWVAFDPRPQSMSEPRPVEEDFRPAPSDDPSPSPSTEPTLAVEPSALPSSAAVSAPDRAGPTFAPAGVTAGLLLVAALAGILLGFALHRARLQRRLLRGTPAQRVFTAWRELTDALRRAGRPAPAHLTATEVAEHASHAAPAAIRAPIPPVHELADLMNIASFAPDETTEEHARRAVELATAYVSALRAGQPWWRRLFWALHVDLWNGRRTPRG
jgi:transglutaminase-like putative cysteine protease